MTQEPKKAPPPPPPPPHTHTFFPPLREKEEKSSALEIPLTVEWNRGAILCALGTRVKNLKRNFNYYVHIYKIGASRVTGGSAGQLPPDLNERAPSLPTPCLLGRTG